jgi:hypothetical protein
MGINAADSEMVVESQLSGLEAQPVIPPVSPVLFTGSNPHHA